MSNPYWLSDAQMERLKPCFPKDTASLALMIVVFSAA